jgi:hypothetical protein
VQKIYRQDNETEPRHGGAIFWDSFKLISQSTALRIVAFATYGHYGAYSGKNKHYDISPSNFLNVKDMWGYKEICFTKKEFDDYFQEFCEKRLKKVKSGDISLLNNYISEITALHPGLVAFTMNAIVERFYKWNTIVNFGDIFIFTKSREFNDALMVNI